MKRQGFRTKREAEAALEEQLGQLRGGAVVAPTGAELGAFLDEWLEGQRSRLRETTWESYRVIVERVARRLGRVKLQALTPLELERFYRELAKTGNYRGGPLSVKSIRNTHTVLRKALSDAERLGLINRNPAATARPPAPDATEHSTWSSAKVVSERLGHATVGITLDLYSHVTPAIGREAADVVAGSIFS